MTWLLPRGVCPSLGVRGSLPHPDLKKNDTNIGVLNSGHCGTRQQEAWWAGTWLPKHPRGHSDSPWPKPTLPSEPGSSIRQLSCEGPGPELQAQSSVGSPADIKLAWSQEAGTEQAALPRPLHSTQCQVHSSVLQHGGRPSEPTTLCMNVQGTPQTMAELSLCSHLLQGVQYLCRTCHVAQSLPPSCPPRSTSCCPLGTVTAAHPHPLVGSL